VRERRAIGILAPIALGNLLLVRRMDGGRRANEAVMVRRVNIDWVAAEVFGKLMGVEGIMVF